MFRCRSFPGQYLLLTLEEREERLDGSESRNPCVKHSPVVMCDGSFEGRRFESCHSLRPCSSIGRARPLPTIPRRISEFDGD